MSTDTASTSSSAPPGRVLAHLRVGHESVLLQTPNEHGHTQRWTVFVRPGEHSLSPDFTDALFVSKVVFVLHQDYVNNRRVVRQPPFEVSETGYGSFDIPLEISFAQNRTYKTRYDMRLFIGAGSQHSQEMIIELKEPNPDLARLARIYGAVKRTASAQPNSSTSSHSHAETAQKRPRPASQSRPPDEKPPSSRNEPSASSQNGDGKRAKLDEESGQKATTEPLSRKRLERLNAAIQASRNPDLLYEAAKELVRLPSTQLDDTTRQLSYADLSELGPEVQHRLYALFSSSASGGDQRPRPQKDGNNGKSISVAPSKSHR